jgi:ribosomal protein RSM22 (predicted rRNA methylase)
MADLESWMPKLISAWRARRANGREPHRREAKGRETAGRRPPHRTGRPEREVDPDSLTSEELKEVAAGVRTLSHGLTRDRELAGAGYMDDERLLGAYLLFFWPVSYAQGRALLGELPRPRSVLDVGSGPGPLAFAALDAGAAEVICADRSRKALDLARALATQTGEPLGTREWSPEQPLPTGSFDLITFGHVLNELFRGDVTKRAAVLEKALGQVRPGGGVLVIEPALRETSRALLETRSVLLSHDVVVRAPCLYRGPCPALEKASDWCHLERPWAPPRVVQAIARAAGLRKEALKMSALWIAPKGTVDMRPTDEQLFRIVSEPLAGKGRLRYMGCGPKGRIGLALQDKHVNDRNKLFAKLVRGDVIRISDAETKGDGIALTEMSTVQMVAAAGRAVPEESQRERS